MKMECTSIQAYFNGLTNITEDINTMMRIDPNVINIYIHIKDLFINKFEIIQQSTITVKKPNALTNAKYASYSMKRSRL